MSALGALKAVYGLGSLLVSGSQIAVGFEIENYGYIFTPTDLKPDLEGCLYDTHAFDYVEISYEQKLIGHDYLIVKGVVATDFANQEDARGLVAGIVRQCAPYLKITREDAITVIPPPERANDPNVANQITQGSLVCRPGQVPTEGVTGTYCRDVERSGQADKDRPGRCDAAYQQGVMEYLSCELGIDKSTVKLVGGFVALLLILKVVKK